MKNIQSLNNRLVVATYKADRAVRADVSSGFALISQKVSVVGLKLLANVTLVFGNETKHFGVGDVAYFLEENLHSAPWAKKQFSDEMFGEEYMIVDVAHVQFIEKT